MVMLSKTESFKLNASSPERCTHTLFEINEDPLYVLVAAKNNTSPEAK